MLHGSLTYHQFAYQVPPQRYKPPFCGYALQIAQGAGLLLKGRNCAATARELEAEILREAQLHVSVACLCRIQTYREMFATLLNSRVTALRAALTH